MRLFLRKRRAKRGCPVGTTSENALDPLLRRGLIRLECAIPICLLTEIPVVWQILQESPPENLWSSSQRNNLPSSGGMHGTDGWHKLPGVADWEVQMTKWLNHTLDHQGPVGEVRCLHCKVKRYHFMHIDRWYFKRNHAVFLARRKVAARDKQAHLSHAAAAWNSNANLLAGQRNHLA